MSAPSKVVDLVIQGTGVKAAGALGAIMALHDAGYRFHRMSGTSSGAIVGALVMAYQTAGRDLHALEEVMTSLDYSQILKKAPLERLPGGMGQGVETLLHGGAYTVDSLRDWLAGELAEVGIAKFGDLRQGLSAIWTGPRRSVDRGCRLGILCLPGGLRAGRRHYGLGRDSHVERWRLGSGLPTGRIRPHGREGVALADVGGTALWTPCADERSRAFHPRYCRPVPAYHAGVEPLRNR